MFTLGVSDHVLVAHSLRDPFFGPAQRVHGATYVIELEVRTPSLRREGVVMDIGAMKSVLRAALDSIDYRNLDDLPAFQDKLSTTENIAAHVADLVAQSLVALGEDARPPTGASLRVVARETPNAWAAFERVV